MERFVYLLRAGEDQYKVGIAKDVLERIKGVQTGNPLKIQLVNAIYSEDAASVESRIHKWLKDRKSDGGREWFKLDAQDALKLITKMTELNMSSDISRYLNMRNLLARQTMLEHKFEDYVLKNNPPTISSIETSFIKEEYVNDPYFDLAKELALINGKVSASGLQRKLRIGYSRASRVLDELTEAGIVSEADGAKPRTTLTIK